MDVDGEILSVLAETTVFLAYFKELPDHRQAAGKVTYQLDEIFLLCPLACLAGLASIERQSVRWAGLAFIRGGPSVEFEQRHAEGASARCTEIS